MVGAGKTDWVWCGGCGSLCLSLSPLTGQLTLDQTGPTSIPNQNEDQPASLIIFHSFISNLFNANILSNIPQ